MKIFPAKVRERVRHVEPGFDDPDFATEYSEETGKYPVEFRLTLEFLANHLAPTQTAEVLEIGPGPGWTSILIAKAYPAVRVVGIDISPTFVEIARRNATVEGVSDRVRFTVNDAESMTGLADRQFDAVISHQSIQYWPAPERVFDQIARVLKPAGFFCITADRRDMNWRGRVQYWLGRFVLSRRISRSWGKSVASCLTVSEARVLVERSQLRNRAQVTGRNRSLQICNRDAPSSPEAYTAPSLK